MAQQDWADALYDALREMGAGIFAYVPDAGHKVMINRSLADPDASSVPLTTEEEGVALLAGAHLGGTPGVLLVQSSGVGNCINMLSLTENGRFPLLIIVSMRGDFGEQNPWQVPMGRGTQPCLEAMGRTEDGIAETRRAVELTGGSSAMLGALGRALGAAGRSEEAMATLDRLIERSSRFQNPIL